MTVGAVAPGEYRGRDGQRPPHHPARPCRMRAVVYDRYGPPDVLHLEHVERPTPKRDQVLVEVLATSVNLSDWEGLVGSPAYARFGGLRRPARHVLGSDIAGRVVAVGSEVTTFRPGDEVYGDNLGLKGGFAELAVAPASVLAPKPPALTFVEASTIPQAGAIALQGTAGAGPGTRVLVNGGGGGTGMFAIQVAKSGGRARDRGRQRRQARPHARAGRRRGARLPARRLHPPGALRPRARPRRPPLGARLPAGPGSGWPVPVRGRPGSHGAERPRRRCGRGSAQRSPDRRPRGEARPGALRPARRSGAWPARSPSTSTAPSRSTRCPRRSPTSARGGPSARSWSSPLSGRPTPTAATPRPGRSPSPGGRRPPVRTPRAGRQPSQRSTAAGRWRPRRTA